MKDIGCNFELRLFSKFKSIKKLILFVLCIIQKTLFMLAILIIAFSYYNFTIYSSKSNYGKVHLSQKGIKGENIWLKNNCNSCHQFYGLGDLLLYQKRESKTYHRPFFAFYINRNCFLLFI